jgi:aromatic-L-amino-acid/L-tryptophan decarboxylase
MDEKVTLDPADWSEFRQTGRRALDDAISRISGLRDRAVWQPVPEAKGIFAADVPPRKGMALGEIYDGLSENVFGHAMGNQHPRFWGWYMGAGSMSGALAEFLAAVDGSNLGGGSTAAIGMERQVVRWLSGMTGFPQDAGGILTSSGSMANFTALAVARNRKAGVDVRREGIAAIDRPLRFYTSDQAHSCIQKALEALGHGTNALRLVPSGDDLAMDLSALERLVREDRAAGFTPAVVIGKAGATNTGAIDDLAGLADFAAREDMWFHVDGCIGAVLKLSPKYAELVAGLEHADSVALDLHKWLQMPFCAGAVLVRDRDAHRATFAAHPDYLEEKARGLAAGEFLADYGMDLSRPFSALKVWMTFQEHGTDKLGRLIDQTIALAQHGAARIAEIGELELTAPVPINIICFRYAASEMSEDGIKALNTEIMLRLQEQGLAIPSDTLIRGRHCLRIAICNHRTEVGDIDWIVDEVLRMGREILAERTAA